jgi:3'(2'), 5'-bisphosphate nucleotidase
MPSVNAISYAELSRALTAIIVRAALTIRAQLGKDDVHRKADGSPVTAADLAAEEVIGAALDRLEPKLPVISEERAKRAKPPAQGSYFLVDPLDGTREFIKRLDEYVINIALMTGHAPVLGLIAAPALGLIWRGVSGGGAERLAFSVDGTISATTAIRTRPQPEQEMTVLVSRSHLDPRTQAYLDGLPQKKRTIACGSALKFCRIAEGSADLYPRLAPTHDWDIAAGQAIVLAAGGSMCAPDGSPLHYGTGDLRIPCFIAAGAMNAPRIKA